MLYYQCTSASYPHPSIQPAGLNENATQGGRAWHAGYARWQRGEPVLQKRSSALHMFREWQIFFAQPDVLLMPARVCRSVSAERLQRPIFVCISSLLPDDTGGLIPAILV